MSEDKKCCSNKWVIILLAINTILLGCICFKLCCLSGKYDKKGKICPLTNKTLEAGSVQKGSPAQ